MDALSDVLSTLRVTSALSSRFEGRGAWAFRFPSYQHIKFGCVLSGGVHVWIEGDESPAYLEEGDFYMLTNGLPFCTASDPDLALFDGPSTYIAACHADGVVRYNGTGCGFVSTVGGRFTFENDVTEILLRSLPPRIHLQAKNLRSHALSQVLDLLRRETSRQHLGSDVASSSLAALVRKR
jgi:hypothetical protein